MPSMTGVAVKIFREVYGFCGGNKDWEKSLRSRARTVPALIASDGLISTVAFLMSKSDGKMFESLLTGGSLENYRKEKEKAGYTLYLYALYRFLSGEKGLIGECKDFVCLAKELEKLDLERGRAAAASELALKFTVEFKKLAEALLEGEGVE